MTEMVFAGFWRRAVAFMIDRIILYFAYLFILFAGIAALSRGFPLDRGMPVRTIMDFSLEFAISYCLAIGLINMSYFTYFHGATGQTPGKMVMGIKVVKVTEEKMTFGTAFLRWVGHLISGAVLYLGFLWVLIDKRKQSWHDKIAGTFVVRIGEEVPDGISPDNLSMDRFSQKIP
jgi:uncharacterized RDD family membrane protein YckC